MTDNDSDGVGTDLEKEIFSAPGSLGAAPTAAPSTATTFTEKPEERAAAKSRRAATKAALDAQPKVTVYIPDGTDEYVKINGVVYIMKGGEQVDVPRQVAQMLQDKWTATAKANKPRQLDLGTI